MKFKVAKILTDIFRNISSWNENNCNENCTPVKKILSKFLPKNNPVNFHPIGYHTSTKLDPNRRCEISKCFQIDPIGISFKDGATRITVSLMDADYMLLPYRDSCRERARRISLDKISYTF